MSRSGQGGWSQVEGWSQSTACTSQVAHTPCSSLSLVSWLMIVMGTISLAGALTLLNHMLAEACLVCCSALDTSKNYTI